MSGKGGVGDGEKLLSKEASRLVGRKAAIAADEVCKTEVRRGLKRVLTDAKRIARVLRLVALGAGEAAEELWYREGWKLSRAGDKIRARFRILARKACMGSKRRREILRRGEQQELGKLLKEASLARARVAEGDRAGFESEEEFEPSDDSSSERAHVPSVKALGSERGLGEEASEGSSEEPDRVEVPTPVKSRQPSYGASLNVQAGLTCLSHAAVSRRVRQQPAGGLGQPAVTTVVCPRSRLPSREVSEGWGLQVRFERLKRFFRNRSFKLALRILGKKVVGRRFLLQVPRLSSLCSKEGGLFELAKGVLRGSSQKGISFTFDPGGTLSWGGSCGRCVCAVSPGPPSLLESVTFGDQGQ